MSKLTAAKLAIESEIAHLESQLNRLAQSLSHLNSVIAQTVPASKDALPGTSGVKKALGARNKTAEQTPEKKATKTPAKKTARVVAAIPAMKAVRLAKSSAVSKASAQNPAGKKAPSKTKAKAQPAKKAAPVKRAASGSATASASDFTATPDA